MGYQILAFSVGIKSVNIDFVVHFDVFIYRTRSVLTEKKLILSHTRYKQLKQPSHYTQTPHTITHKQNNVKQPPSYHL